MDAPEGTQQMLHRAVASASRHGICLLPGRLNSATGDCAFESVIFNNNDRACFPNKFLLSTDYHRRIWMTDMQSKSMDNPT